MTPKLPICCSPVAYRMLAEQLDVLESPGGLIRGAVAVARHQLEDAANPDDVEREISRLATTVAERVHGSQPQAVLAHLHEFLFEEEKFVGNTQDYYNPLNSYLPHVLQAKSGLPITLCLIYKAAAEKLGIKVWGLGLPGHFLTAVEVDGSPMWIDAFSGGREVTPSEAKERLISQFGKDVEWNDQFTQPVNNRYWLTRMLQNLLSAFSRQGHYADVAAVLEMEMQLWPTESRLHRDLALVLARIGMSESATAWLDHYLQNNPDDPHKGDLKQLLATLAA